MKKLLIAIVVILTCHTQMKSQCSVDTISNDIIMMVDNSASINNAEFGSFSNIILSSINRIAADCPLSRRGVVHYGGAFGQSVNIEHPLSSTTVIPSINRQYCLNATCNDGGDDLNYAMGEIIRMINNNELQLDPDNRLSIVVFTDAFSDSFCASPNCSVTLPTTNVDILKSTYGANVSVIGMSSDARAEFLAITASPGGTYSAAALNNACNASIDGCSLPRQYIPVEFTDNPLTVGAQVAALVTCQENIISTANVDAGSDQTICSDRGESASLMAVSTSGQAPFTYAWSNNLGTGTSVVATPAMTTTFTVTITDDNGCEGTDQVRVIVETCGPNCVDDSILVGGNIILEPKVIIDAGPDQTFCENLGATATINLTAIKGQEPISYQWDHNQGTNSSIIVRPLVATTYRVTATDDNNCTAVDSILITPIQCSDCFAEAGVPLEHKEVCLENNRATITTEDNIGINIPQGYEKVYILTNRDLTIIDYVINGGSFSVAEAGLYRVHTLVAEVNSRNDENYFDINVITRGSSNLFVVANCIIDHNICADFDFPGRVHVILPPGDMMCMTFENTINLCNDGIDNDSDGLVDCMDEDCKSLVPCLENTLIACNDLYDNDGDGLVDCFDSDCWEFIRCFEREENCKDGIDNDGDGLIDCEDDSCFGSAECMENSPYTCKDGIDNDRDGLIDCQEESCREFLVCAEWGEAACTDGIDNDSDGLVDCADAECRLSFPSTCGAIEASAAFCGDGIDNDADGLVDCADPDCGVTSLSLEDITAAITNTSSTCPNNNNGSLTIDLAQTGWEYSINNGESFSTNTTYDNLTQGDYPVILRRASGCTIAGPTITITGEQCPEICDNGIDDDGDGAIDCEDSDCGLIEALPAIATDPVCPQADNGSIRLFFLSGGNTAGIEYSLDGVVWQDSPIFRNLIGGTYNVDLRTSNGCSARKTYILTTPDCPEVCNNGLDDDGDGAIDCEDSDCGITLTASDVSVTTLTCPSENDGTITVSHSESGLQYKIDSSALQDAPLFENLMAGSYLITVVNGSGCQDTLRVSVAAVDCSEICDNGIDDDGNGFTDCEDITCQDGFASMISVVNSSCPNNTNGSIAIDSALLGSVYSINDGPTQSAALFENLIPGTYDLTILNADGCTMTTSVVLEGTDCSEICDNGIDDDGNGLIDCEDGACTIGLDASASSTSTSCPNNNNGTIRIENQQGGMSYSLNGETFQDEGLFENLEPGNYILTIQNINGCTSIQTVIVEGEVCVEVCDNGIDDDGNGLIDCEDPSCGVLTFDGAILVTNDDCAPENNGFIEITGQTDGVNYSYSIDGGENFETFREFEGLAQGTYTVVIMTEGNCSYSQEVSISKPSCTEICDNGIDDDANGLVDCEDGACQLGLDVNVEVVQASCPDNNNGIIRILEATAGSQFSIDGQNFQDASLFEGLQPDTYTLTIQNAEGCLNNIEATIIETICSEICDNGIDDDGNGLIDCEDPSCGVQTFDGAILVTDDNCNPENNGFIEITGQTDGVNYSYSIDGGENFETFREFEGLAQGTYTVVIMTEGNCSYSQEVIISKPSCTEICDNGIDDDGNGLVDCEDGACNTGLEIQLEVSATTCPDNDNGRLQIFGLAEGSEVSFNGQSYQSVTVYEDLEPGDYTVNIRNTEGCINSMMATITESICMEICDNGIDDDGNGLVDCEDDACSSNLLLEFSATDATCPDNNNGSIQVISTDTTSLYSIDGENFQSEKLFENLSQGDYTLTEQNTQGCLQSVVVSINASACVESEICNNGLDDNGDGLIDCEDGTCSAFSNFIVAANPPGCLEDSDGRIIIIDGLEGYQYSLSGSAFQLSSSFDSLSVGEYLLSIRNNQGCDTTITTTITTDVPCSVMSEGLNVALQMNINVFLEGPFDPNTGRMNTLLNDQGYLPGQLPITYFGKRTPSGQPFHQAPWFYQGPEGDQMIDNVDRLQSAYAESIVDWVLVSLRTNLNHESEVFQGAGLLHNDGRIEMQRLAEVPEDDREYYIVIEHRNHLPIMSPTPIPIVQGEIVYDFSARNSYRSVIGMGQLNINGTYVMAAGNGDMILDSSSDVDINIRDLNAWLLNNGENSSYYYEDYDLNGDINIKDRILWEKNNGSFSPIKTK